MATGEQEKVEKKEEAENVHIHDSDSEEISIDERMYRRAVEVCNFASTGMRMLVETQAAQSLKPQHLFTPLNYFAPFSKLDKA